MLLDAWEHRCCGDSRMIGVEVIMTICAYSSDFHGQCHDYGQDGGVRAITGQITDIKWRPAVAVSLDQSSGSRLTA